MVAKHHRRQPGAVRVICLVARQCGAHHGQCLRTPQGNELFFQERRGSPVAVARDGGDAEGGRYQGGRVGAPQQRGSDRLFLGSAAKQLRPHAPERVAERWAAAESEAADVGFRAAPRRRDRRPPAPALERQEGRSSGPRAPRGHGEATARRLRWERRARNVSLVQGPGCAAYAPVRRR